MSTQKTRLRQCIFFCIWSLCFFIPDGVNATEPPPNLATTTAWLQDNLPTVFFDFDQLSYLNESAKYVFYGCNLSMEVTTRSKNRPVGEGSGNTVYTLRIAPSYGKTFYVSTIDNAVVPNESMMIKQKTMVNFHDIQPIIEKAKHNIGDSHDNFSAMNALNVAPKEIAVTTNDERLAGRLEKALLHLAKLCGSKPDPF